MQDLLGHEVGGLDNSGWSEPALALRSMWPVQPVHDTPGPTRGVTYVLQKAHQRLVAIKLQHPVK